MTPEHTATLEHRPDTAARASTIVVPLDGSAEAVAALPVGSEVLLLVTTEDREKLQIRGRISWQLQVAMPAAYFTGVEFSGMTSSVGKRWRAYVDRCIRSNARRLKK